MSPLAEKRILQAIVAIACLLPLVVGTLGVIAGPAMLVGVGDQPPPDLDSHFRYLSGIFLMLGLAFASCVPRIEVRTARFRLLGAMVIAGGLARGLSWIDVGAPTVGHRIGLVIELGLVPLLLLWQARVAIRLRAK